MCNIFVFYFRLTQNAAYGNFSGPKIHEIAVSRGKVLELLRLSDGAKLVTVVATEVGKQSVTLLCCVIMLSYIRECEMDFCFIKGAAAPHGWRQALVGRGDRGGETHLTQPAAAFARCCVAAGWRLFAAVW